MVSIFEFIKEIAIEQGKVVVSLFEIKNPIGEPLVDLSGNITREDLKGPMTDATFND